MISETTSVPAGASFVPDENIDPAAGTAPSSPNKLFSPSTPKSTPLHRRFLQEVTMSPATPPSTPSRNRRRSPSEARESPSKQKLEIGQNGFYFSYELPMRKVTPKKNATPTKDPGGGTPTRRTPSPLKNESPVKQNPTNFIFSTPTKKTPKERGAETPTRRTPSPLKERCVKQSPARKLFDTPAKSGKLTPVRRAIDGNGSPKKVIRAASRFPTPMPSIPPQCFTNVTDGDGASTIASSSATTKLHSGPPRIKKAVQTTKSTPSNIGHLIANFNSGAYNARDWTAAERMGEAKVSPAPTPLRIASEKLHLGASPAFLRIANKDRDGPSMAHESLERDTQLPQPPFIELLLSNGQTRSGKKVLDAPTTTAIEDLPSEEFPAMPKHPDDDYAISGPVGTQSTLPPPVSIAEPRFVPDGTRNAQVLHYPPTLFPKPKPEIVQNEKGSRLEKYVKLQKKAGIPRPQASRSEPGSQHRRVGTDPNVLMAMKKEMDKVGASMRASTGQEIAWRGPANNNELPAMSNTIFMADKDFKKSGIVGVPTGPPTLSRVNSDTLSIGSVRATKVVSAQKRTVTPNTTGPGRAVSHIKAPASKASNRREKVVVNQQRGGDRTKDGTTNVKRTLRARPINTASNKSSQPKATAGTAARQRPRMPNALATPCRPEPRNLVLRPIPLGSPAKTKALGTLPSRGVGKVNLNSPAVTRATPVSKPPALSRKPPVTSRPMMTQKRDRPMTPPYDPSTDPRPYEDKFASATDIAGRVTEWKTEDRRKASVEIPPAGLPKTPSRPALTLNTAQPNKDPSTLPRSPSKLPSPIKHPKPPNPTTAQTKAAPKTPQPKKTAVTRLRDRTDLRTPGSSRIPLLDRNALRTPSKAIDAKIAEYARTGNEFTPSGNRVKDLLEARGLKGP